MNTAFLYVRVSTDEQADKGYSQRSQDEVLQRYCENKSIQVDKVIYEDHSAKSFNRPEWKEMLRLIKKSNKNRPTFLLFTKWDRFSRNTSDAYQMISLLNSYDIEPQAIEQPLDLSIPENKMMLAFYLAVPEVENDRRGLNIFYGLRRAKKEGRWMGHAPVGYENKSTDDGRKYIRPNVPQANLMKCAFEDIATGKYTIEQVWEKARKNGLESKSTNFQTAIRNPVYCGMIIIPEHKEEPGQLAKGQHEAIISEELFNKVQLVLRGNKMIKGTTMSSLVHYPLRGFLKCIKCKRMLTASTSKGRNDYYHYYHCSNTCRGRFKASVLNQDFLSFLQNLTPKNSYKLLFREILKDIFKQHTSWQQRQREQTITSLEHQSRRLAKIREMLIDGKFEPADYLISKVEIESKVNSLTNQLSKLPDIEESITKLLNSKSKKFLDLRELYQVSSIPDKRRLIVALFTEPLIYDNEHFLTKIASAVDIIYKPK